MKSFKKLMPTGIPCLVIIVALFGYLGSVMGLANMLNTVMKTAHDLLLNTCFYLMGICVVTGALGKIFVEFGVVDLIQKALRPIMQPLFNLPGVASLGAVLTFLSDNPAIIALSKDKKFSRYFKKYQLISLTNFGTAFGMGLIVIVFMMGQGYFAAPFIGFVGAMFGCAISTRLMQYFTCKDYPNYREENALSDEEIRTLDAEVSNQSEDASVQKDSTFVHVLNALLDGGKDGVSIGLAIIPGVLIISTLVMMLTFGGSIEGVDADGKAIEVYTGAAYQGTQLLPWLASKISFVFDWLFGFKAPELVSFPITALGAVGAALGLLPKFSADGILDGNAIAVCTAMGMCWSGYLSTHTAMLDSLGYRKLLSRAFLSHFFGGIGAGVVAHWVFVGIFAIQGIFAPKPVWDTTGQAFNCHTSESFDIAMTLTDDSVYTVNDWMGTKGYPLSFKVNAKDSTVVVTNAYADKNGKYYFVHINQDAHRNEPSYAALCVTHPFSQFVGDEKKGHFYSFIFIYDGDRRLIDRGYYELVWGGEARQTLEAEAEIERANEEQHARALQMADSIRVSQIADSIYQTEIAR